MLLELKPQYENVKSYYGKAIIEKCDNVKYLLFSYGVEICEYYPKTQKVKFLSDCYYHYTRTTLRHIKEFLKQFANIDNLTKKDIFKMANL